MVRISQLSHSVDLNGKAAMIVTGENDEGKYVVKHEDRLLRLKRCHLAALDDFVNDDEDEGRPAKAPRQSL